MATGQEGMNKQIFRMSNDVNVNRIPTDKELADIAHTIGKEWELFAAFLDTSKATVEHIKKDNEQHVQRVYQLLQICRRRNETIGMLQKHIQDTKDCAAVVVYLRQRLGVCTDKENDGVTDQDLSRSAFQTENEAANFGITQGQIAKLKQSYIYSRTEQAVQMLEEWCMPSLDDDTCIRVLLRAHNELTLTLDVHMALDAVRSELQPQDVTDIESLFTTEAKCRVLIRRISKGGVKTYQIFKRYLKNHQKNLYHSFHRLETELRLETQSVDEDSELIDELHNYITRSIKADWENIALHMGISQESVGRVRNDRYSQEDQPYQMLREWYQTHSSEMARMLSESATSSNQKEEQHVSNNTCVYCKDGDEPGKIARHVHDGRLVELSEKYILHLKQCLSDPNTATQGGFGKIYIVSQVSAFKGRVVLKEIDVGKSEERRNQLLGSVTSEKLASRVMHFGILPLLAYHDDHKEGKYYFISPYLEKGDLYEAIKSDRIAADKGILMDMNARLKVMYQIACAIDYMHTENSFRGTLIHMDIKSKNIVLDQKLNARLIDFGLARELKEGHYSATMTTAYGTMGYLPTVDHRRLTRTYDYHSFGVVIRELLTGLYPEATDTNKNDLRQWQNSTVIRHLQTRIWDKGVASQVADIAALCIKSVQACNLSSKDLYNKIEKLMRDPTRVAKWNSLENNQCEICIINESVPDLHTDISHGGCSQKIKTCCACMRNSYINPVKCYECGQTVKSIIGDGWGAILIAGYDKTGREMFHKDVKLFGDAITSLVLPAMCVSTSNLIVIDSNTKTTESVTLMIDKAFEQVSSKKIHTLVFHYSGHNDENKGFMLGLGESDYYSMDMINTNLKKCQGVTKIISFLDCCKPKHFEVPDDMCLIQFNATGPKCDAKVQLDEGSFFTKYLVQAFTLKASGGECSLHGEKCKLDGDFITLGSLWNYINDHRSGLESMEPHLNMQNVDWRNTYLAYNFAFKVEFSFEVSIPDSSFSKMINILATNLTDFKALIPEILFPEFVALLTEKFKSEPKALMSDISKYANVLSIEVDSASRHVEEIDNMQKLLLAWNSKRLLRCKPRLCTRIGIGMPVGLFLKQGKLCGEMVSEIHNQENTFDLADLEHLIQTLEAQESKLQSAETLESSLEEFIGVISNITINSKDKLTGKRMKIDFIDVFGDGSVSLVYLELKDPDAA